MAPPVASLTSVALPILVDVALKGTLVLLVAAALAWLARRSAASVRHLIWATALVGLLALPVLHAALPRWHAGGAMPRSEAPRPASVAQTRSPPAGDWLVPDVRSVPTPRRNPPAGEDKAVLLASRAAPDSAPEAPAPAPPSAPTALPATAVSLGELAVALWLVGAVVLLLGIALGWLSVRRLRGGSRLLQGNAVPDVFDELIAELGIRRPVQVRLTSRRTIPMTWGILRPVILLPEEATAWSDARLRMVLLHELGHIKRWDCLVQLLGHVARALYWFHPLAWLAVARLRAEQENACDDIVLERGAAPPDYAEHLLAVTARLPLSFFASGVALGMARRARLQQRLETVLEASRDRRPLRRRSLLVASILALLLLTPLASVGFRSTEIARGSEALVVVDDVEQKAADKPVDPFKRLAEIQKKLQENYVAPINEKRLWDQALKGLLKGLDDPFTDYLSDEVMAQLQAQFKGGVTGIGAQLRITDGRLTVVTPLEDSPALKAGIRPGDFIEIIDGKATRGMEIQDAIKQILGQAGAAVKLRVVHADGVVEELTVTRAPIRLPTVHGFRRDAEGRWQFLLDAEHKVGYLLVQQFGGGTAREVREAVEGLKKDGLKGLILDLRFCPGGLLNQAIEVGSLFLKDGTIVTTRGPNKKEYVFKADGQSWLGDFPMIVLLNEQTASAGEILAGALRDHSRAILVGSRSYGKGSVQTLVKLDEGGTLKLTTAHHYLPSGRNIQKRPGDKSWGVDPTDGYYIPLTQAQRDSVQKSMQDRSILGHKKDEQPRQPARITPKVIEEFYADSQLGPALRTMVARLTGGDFIKVGKDNAVLLDHVQRLEEMRQRRETLLQNLHNLDREITDLQRLVGDAKKKD